MEIKNVPELLKHTDFESEAHSNPETMDKKKSTSSPIVLNRRADYQRGGEFAKWMEQDFLAVTVQTRILADPHSLFVCFHAYCFPPIEAS